MKMPAAPEKAALAPAPPPTDAAEATRLTAKAKAAYVAARVEEVRTNQLPRIQQAIRTAAAAGRTHTAAVVPLYLVRTAEKILKEDLGFSASFELRRNFVGLKTSKATLTISWPAEPAPTPAPTPAPQPAVMTELDGSQRQFLTVVQRKWSETNVTHVFVQLERKSGLPFGIRFAEFCPPENKGVFVLNIMAGLPASASPIRIGDRLVSMNGIDAHDIDLEAIVVLCRDNTTIDLCLGRLLTTEQ